MTDDYRFISFVRESEYYVDDFYYIGFFDVDLPQLYKIYCKRPELRDDWVRLIHISWDYCSSGHMPIEDDYKRLISSLFQLIDIDAIDSKTATKAYRALLYSACYHANTYKRDRLTASLYTNRSDIRKKVFRRYGKKCLNCGSLDNITIDHIVPVVSGGKNHIENLQPLCKPCNSSKGVETKDYRGELVCEKTLITFHISATQGRTEN